MVTVEAGAAVALDVDAAGPLIARRGRRRRADGRRESTPVRCWWRRRRACRRPPAGRCPPGATATVTPTPLLRRRHALLDGQRLAHAIAGDRREHLTVRLVADLAVHAPVRATRLPFNRGSQLAEVGVVGLQRRAVLAVLVEEVAAKACGKRRGRPDSRRRPAPRRTRRRPACRRRRGRRRRPGCSRRSSRPRQPPMPSSRRGRRRQTATAGPSRASPRRPPPAASATVGRRVTTCTHADQRVGAIQIAGAASHDLHAVDRRGRHTVPVHPAAKRIVEHLAVGQHQRTAGARGRQSPQTGALCRRVRAARRRPAEEAESRHDLEHVVERHRWRQREVARGEDGHGRGGAGGAPIAARRRHDHRVGKRRRVEGHAVRAL